MFNYKNEKKGEGEKEGWTEVSAQKNEFRASGSANVPI